MLDEKILSLYAYVGRCAVECYKGLIRDLNLRCWGGFYYDEERGAFVISFRAHTKGKKHPVDCRIEFYRKRFIGVPSGGIGIEIHLNPLANPANREVIEMLMEICDSLEKNSRGFTLTTKICIHGNCKEEED